jgi:N-acetylmuramoyl-L-alanine amidase
MDILYCSSPNFNDRPEGAVIDSIIIHYSGKACVEDVIDHFQNPESLVSAHYTICRDGVVYQHVPENKRAWHAGVSRFGPREEFNHFSIGIELYNPGHNRGYIAYTESQITQLIVLIQDIYHRHPIRPEFVLGHSDIAPTRKQDPGELFPWACLERLGLAKRPQTMSQGLHRKRTVG